MEKAKGKRKCIGESPCLHVEEYRDERDGEQEEAEGLRVHHVRAALLVLKVAVAAEGAHGPSAAAGGGSGIAVVAVGGGGGGTVGAGADSAGQVILRYGRCELFGKIV